MLRPVTQSYPSMQNLRGEVDPRDSRVGLEGIYDRKCSSDRTDSTYTLLVKG